MKVQMVLAFEAEILNPNWTEEDLKAGAEGFLQRIIDDEQAESWRLFGKPDYQLGTGASGLKLYTLQDFLTGLRKAGHAYNDRAGNGYCFDCGLPKEHPEAHHMEAK